MTAKSITFVTSNANKLRDVTTILGSYGITVNHVKLALPEIQGTIEEITLEKCRATAAIVGGPVLVEDTSLCFKAMGDLPGPYIKWFLEALGPQGLYKMLEGFSDKRAQAVATLGYCEKPGQQPLIFQGRADGEIVRPRGTTKFGWHCAFECKSTGLTYAETEETGELKISHLRSAVEDLVKYLSR